MATSAASALARSFCRNRTLLTMSRMRLSTTASRAAGEGGNYPRDYTGPQRSHEEASQWVEKEVKGKWHGFGIWKHDRKLDYQMGHMMMWTICAVFAGTFMWYYYYPDPKMADWQHREAYLLIREREARGQVLIDRNLVDPAKVNLPSDEELRDVEIII